MDGSAPYLLIDVKKDDQSNDDIHMLLAANPKNKTVSEHNFINCYNIDTSLAIMCMTDQGITNQLLGICDG